MLYEDGGLMMYIVLASIIFALYFNFWHLTACQFQIKIHTFDGTFVDLSFHHLPRSGLETFLMKIIYCYMDVCVVRVPRKVLLTCHNNVLVEHSVSLLFETYHK